VHEDGRIPFMAAPVETPIMPSSDSGVSKTRVGPEAFLQARASSRTSRSDRPTP
jgi:hypothetical protein